MIGHRAVDNRRQTARANHASIKDGECPPCIATRRKIRHSPIQQRRCAIENDTEKWKDDERRQKGGKQRYCNQKCCRHLGGCDATNNPQTLSKPIAGRFAERSANEEKGKRDANDRRSSAARMDQERLKAMNEDRQKKLAADVDRLLALTNELKYSLDKTNKDQLSLEVMRKAAEIEKLAHDVQSRMKN